MAKICLSQIKSSTFKISSYAGPSVVPYAKLHFDTATFPMEFISMDLIGELYPPSKSGHKYALTIICMFTGYVFCIPLKTK